MSAFETYAYTLCAEHGFPEADNMTGPIDRCPGCLFEVGRRHPDQTEFLSSIEYLINFFMERWDELDCLEYLPDLHTLADAEYERLAATDTHFSQGAAVQG